IYSCLLASTHEVNFITACDIPEMNFKLIQNMIKRPGTDSGGWGDGKKQTGYPRQKDPADRQP
ncbi:MAG: hypothetical protein ACRCUT_05080, partial [Spirochaetota bacterium]